MNQEVIVNETMNILKQLITDINSIIQTNTMNEEFQYIIEGANELLDIYFNASNEIRLFYKKLDNKILLSRSMLLLKQLIFYTKESINILPENINNTISAAVQLSNNYYVSNN